MTEKERPDLLLKILVTADGLADKLLKINDRQGGPPTVAAVASTGVPRVSA